MNKSPEHQPNASELTRRDFVKSGSLATAMMMLGGVPLIAQEAPKEEGQFDANAVLTRVPVGVIGCGYWGRDILTSLARLPKAEVVAVCETYEPFLRRAKTAAPKAEPYTDYRKVLENKDVKAVIVATPTHQHKEIAIEALKAGKHVYCESPLAASIDDARDIARAAREHPKSYFQSGQLLRSHPHLHFLLPFIRSGAAGTPILARAQWHKKTSWRRISPNPEREKEINWRLQKDKSLGLVGEIGIQQFDMINWFWNRLPTAVTGFGGILFWQDGRDVEDTSQTVFEYAGGRTMYYEATLANSFDSDYEMLYGSDAAVMVRGNRAWMFKEVDSPLLGWEVYARKDSFLNETGIALAANASKIVAQGDKGSAQAAPYADPPVQYALEAFLNNAELIGNAVTDFEATFDGADIKALKEFLAGMEKSKSPAATYQDGYEATVVAIKANEAVQKKQRVKIDKELFEI